MLRIWALKASVAFDRVYFHLLPLNYSKARKKNNHYSVGFFLRFEKMQEVFIMKIFHYSSYKNDIKRPTNFTEKKNLLKIQQFHHLRYFIAPQVLPWDPFCWWHHLTPWPWDVEDTGHWVSNVPTWIGPWVHKWPIWQKTQKNNTTNPGDTKNV